MKYRDRPKHLRKRRYKFRSYRAVASVRLGQDANISVNWESKPHFTWDELKEFAAWLYTVVNFHEGIDREPR